LPQIGYTGLIDALEWVLIGTLWLICLALRPRGLIPERRHTAAQPEVLDPAEPPVGAAP
jgi:hypothetical protein